MNGIIIPAFEAANPDIIVKDDTLPYDGLLNKFIASSAAGDPPSVMRSDIAWVPQLAPEGVRLNVKATVVRGDEEGARSRTVGNDFGAVATMAFSDDTNTQVLFMNTADFAAAGLTAPTTYAQMYR